MLSKLFACKWGYWGRQRDSGTTFSACPAEAMRLLPEIFWVDSSSILQDAFLYGRLSSGLSAAIGRADDDRGSAFRPPGVAVRDLVGIQ
jgi:hypothetical protein